MIMNWALVFLEAAVLGSVMLLLHRASTRFGLVLFFFLMGSLLTLLQLIAVAGLFFGLTPDQFLAFSTHVLVPVILLGVLITYIVEGTVAARITMAGIVLLNFATLLGLTVLTVNAGSPESGLASSLPPELLTLLPGPLTAAASSITFLLDLVILVLVYQFVRNRLPQGAAWLAPGIALLASLWADTLVFQLVTTFSPVVFEIGLADQLVSTIGVTLILWPLAAYYLSKGAPRLPHSRPFELRPTLDLLFGSFGRLETALSQTEAHLQRRTAEQRALDATLMDITESQDLDQLLHMIVARAVRFLGGTSGGLYLCEPKQQQVRCVVSYQTRLDFTGTCLAYGEGAAGLVAQSGQPVIVGDYSSWPGRARVYADEPSFHSILSAPLKWNLEVLGVIHVLDSDNIDRFTKADQELLMAFANHAAVAVNNARMLEEARSRLEESDRLREASAIVATTLEQDLAIQRILDQLKNVVPFDSACVMLLKDDTELEIVGGRGWEDPSDVIGMCFPIPGNNPNSVVIETGAPYVLTDAPKEFAEFKKEPHSHIRSWLGVPLIFQHDVIGMLAIDHALPGFFNSNHLRMASAFANQVAIAIGNARLYSLENQRVEELDALRGILADLTSDLTLPTLLESILKKAVMLVGASGGDLGLYDEREQTIRIVVSHNLGKDYRGTIMQLEEGAMGHAIALNEAVIIDDYSDWWQRSSQFNEGSWHAMMSAPLLTDGRLVGAISVVNADPAGQFTDADKQLLVKLAEQAAIAIQNATRFEEAQAQAMTDSLTGLFNRRAFDKTLKHEVAEAIRYKRHLSLAILDIDDFKAYNDAYGHPAGDEQLKLLAGLLLENVRESDWVARYGGEEFAIIFPSCDKADAVNLLERIRAAAEAVFPHPVQSGDLLPGYTLSIGVATFPENAQSEQELLIAADTAELLAKQQGKNRVVGANGSVPKEFPERPAPDDA